MAKKVAPKLLDLGATIYAVLSPGVGFLKEVFGECHFHDSLPRASGCFISLEEAESALIRARDRITAELDHVYRTYPTSNRVGWIQDKLDAANRAVVVELGFKPHGQWTAPPPPVIMPKSPPIKDISSVNIAQLLESVTRLDRFAHD